MANMSYCRFRNTCGDLSDCEEHMGDDDLSREEEYARKALIRLCIDIAEQWGHEVTGERR